MTNKQMQTVLAQNGVSVGDIAKIQDNLDIEKISYIVEAATSPESAFETIHDFYPELEVEELQKQCEFVLRQVEALMKKQKNADAVELTEDELDTVSGGGIFGSISTWFKQNWKAVAICAAIVVGGALICTKIAPAISSSIETAGGVITTAGLALNEVLGNI